MTDGIEGFSSSDGGDHVLSVLEDVDGFDELTGLVRAAAEFAEYVPGLELRVRRRRVAGMPAGAGRQTADEPTRIAPGRDGQRPWSDVKPGNGRWPTVH